MTHYVEFLPLTGKSKIEPVKERDTSMVEMPADTRIFGFRFFDSDGEMRGDDFVGKKENISGRYLYGQRGRVTTREEIIQDMGRANTLVERMEHLGYETTFVVDKTHHVCMEKTDQVI